MPVAAHDIGRHVFTFVFAENEATSLEHAIDTDLGEEDQGVRMVRMVARDGGDGQLHVEDTLVGNCVYPEGAVDTTADSSGECDNAEGRLDSVESILAWRAPTVEESERRCAEMLQASPVRDTSKDTPAWEQRLNKLVEEQTRSSTSLLKLASQESMQAVVEQPVRTLYRLRLTNLKTAVLHPPPNERDAQVVYDRPSYGEHGGGASKELGREERSIIEVEEEKDGWLRYRPQPGDLSQCWVKKVATNGRWELAPAQSSSELQMEFFVESSLEMLMFALGKDAEVSEVLLSCTRRFAGRLAPLSLFDSAGPIIEKALSALILWLTERVTAATPATDSVLVVLVQLVLARGTLPALLQLAQFLTGHPQVVNPELLSELKRLSDVEGFELAAQAAFSTEPGSTEDLIARWTVRQSCCIIAVDQPRSSLTAVWSLVTGACAAGGSTSCGGGNRKRCRGRHSRQGSCR